MDLLERISEITVLSEKVGDLARQSVETFTFKKGSVILEPEKVCNHLFFLTEGMMRGFYYAEGKEVTNWIAVEGDFATSFYSFISKSRSYETIEALENTRLEAISYRKLNEIYALYPETEKVGRIILENYYLKLEERVISIQFKSAKERYESLAERRPEIIRRAPLGCIASYLGITQETLSRIRAS